jgi:hypothetical protein
MLIVKGDCGKSRVIDVLMAHTDSICFVYNNYPLIYKSICVDSGEYSLENFLECISNELKEAVVNDKHYDYLLIYTNQNEEDLKEIVDWLKKYKFNIPCRDIVLTCK